MDITEFKAHGPWVLIKPEEQAKMSPGGIHLVDDHAAAKVGYNVGQVVSAGIGYWKVLKSGKIRFDRMVVKPGDRVVYRVHLEKPCQFSGGHSFIHMQDLEIALGPDVELGLALPYDN
jgi:co-chaperonin GroES (HSP10)